MITRNFPGLILNYLLYIYFEISFFLLLYLKMITRNFPGLDYTVELTLN